MNLGGGILQVTIFLTTYLIFQWNTFPWTKFGFHLLQWYEFQNLVLLNWSLAFVPHKLLLKDGRNIHILHKFWFPYQLLKRIYSIWELYPTEFILPRWLQCTRLLHRSTTRNMILVEILLLQEETSSITFSLHSAIGCSFFLLLLSTARKASLFEGNMSKPLNGTMKLVRGTSTGGQTPGEPLIELNFTSGEIWCK